MSTRNETNYPIGSRVIVRSNNDEPLMIGELVEWPAFGSNEASTPIPVVKDEENGEKFFCMGVMCHYDEKLITALDKLTPAEQWNVLAEFGHKR